MTAVNAVISFVLSWRFAVVAVAVLAEATLVLRLARRRRLAAVTAEGALLFALLVLWTFGATMSVLSRAGALARARWIWRFERAVGLPSEAAVQHPFLAHPLLVQLFNWFYGTAQFPVMFAFLVWLFLRHRDSYARWRTTLVGFTGISLLIQLMPVAPPRMLPGTGMIDTAMVYHQSVYGSVAGFNPNELSAMPSVHVGWALLIGVAVIALVRTRWRWLALLYPGVTTLAVIVTANHFWLDGIVAAAILAVVLAAQAAARRLGRQRAPQPIPVSDAPPSRVTPRPAGTPAAG